MPKKFGYLAFYLLLCKPNKNTRLHKDHNDTYLAAAQREFAHVEHTIKLLGFGGSYEPRPDRVGSVATTDVPQYTLSVDAPGEYRLYVYVLDGTGFVSTENIPFQVK